MQVVTEEAEEDEDDESTDVQDEGVKANAEVTEVITQPDELLFFIDKGPTIKTQVGFNLLPSFLTEVPTSVFPCCFFNDALLGGSFLKENMSCFHRTIVHQTFPCL